MSKLFEDLLISSPNGGGLYYSRCGEVFCLDSLDTTGFSYQKDIFLRGFQPDKLCIYNDTVKLISGEAVNFDDVHDVIWVGGYCYVVGTAGNEIIQLSRTGLEVQRWVFPGEIDSRHINCLASWKGRIVFSAFGDFSEHRGYKKETVGAGFVQDLVSGERLISGLSQPHSLCPVGDRLFLANSEKSEIIEFSANGSMLRSKEMDGYTRGILVHENVIYVGLSCSRNTVDTAINSAIVVALDLQTFDELDRLHIPAKEIYSIQSLADQGDIARALAVISGTSSAMTKEISKRNTELISSLNQAVSEREAQIESLTQVVSEREAQIESLTQVVSEREAQIESLTQVVSEREAQIKSLNQASLVEHFYKSVYRRGGLALRKILSDKAVGRIKRILPDPHGVPNKLAYAPLISHNDDIVIDDIDGATDKPDVFIFSIIDWDFRTQRPQHIARLLAQNHRVFYIEMMLEMNGPSVRKISDRLFVIRISRHSIGHIQPYVGIASAPQTINWIANFISFCEQVSATSFKHVIIQHPFWWQMVRHLPPEFRTIFDCMDDIAGFSNTTDWMLENELNMASECDQLIVSSAWLQKKYASVNQPLLIRNGGDLLHFDPEKANVRCPDFLLQRGFSKLPGKIDVGYVGAIAEWFDVDLIRKSALLNPEIEFHLCGGVSTNEAASLEKLSNVTMYGEISYVDVPAFIEQMDVMTIPFQLLPIIQACDPVKFYEYSAMGKPTVSTRLPELDRARDLLFLSTGPEEFSANLRKAHEMGQSVEFQDDLRRYAANNTWEHRSDLFERAFEDLPKVSVVVLSYGDPSLTINTIKSLVNEGQTYPNMELIVVDNGSSKDQLLQLQNAIESCSIDTVRLIENQENLGFARGNNVGLEQATGEYVMLLNNDTYVAPGAIAAMVNHLRVNPLIGVVGPMTNNIGNEARVEISYDDMPEMIRKARELTIGYRGSHTEMRVVAYFAAMFRRQDLTQFGLLSEDYGLGMFEDDDHCAVIRTHGFICALAEDAFVHHELSATFDTIGARNKRKLFEANKKVYENKWGDWQPHQYRKQRPSSTLNS